jgi:DnaD/phage-associated family protein
LKLTLHLFRLLYFKKGSPQYVALSELKNDAGLMAVMSNNGETLQQALAAAVQRKTMLHVAAEDGKHDDVYLLNTAANREAAEKIEGREKQFAGFEMKRIIPEIPAAAQPNIFTIYEENIGLLTPMIAEELRDAEKTYPEVWIRDAIKEAVNAGKRNWRYISAILARWETEGKSDGTHLRDFKKTDPDKFIKGKYGHAVKR